MSSRLFEKIGNVEILRFLKKAGFLLGPYWQVEYRGNGKRSGRKE